MNLLYIDLFCGAGGVTTGISQVPGVHVVACVNHDADAIASHAANHPRTLHYTEDIRTLDTAPMVSRLETMRARYPWAKTVLWASCECTNFSRAKGGKPRDPDSRSLAEHLYRYIEALEPDYIQIENVTEFLEWGPLIEQDGQLMPDPDRKGDSFREWFSHIEGMGYKAVGASSIPPTSGRTHPDSLVHPICPDRLCPGMAEADPPARKLESLPGSSGPYRFWKIHFHEEEAPLRQYAAAAHGGHQEVCESSIRLPLHDRPGACTLPGETMCYPVYAEEPVPGSREVHDQILFRQGAQHFS